MIFLFSNKITKKWICAKCQIAWFWHVASQLLVKSTKHSWHRFKNFPNIYSPNVDQ